jgi:hypothetical protein
MDENFPPVKVTWDETVDAVYVYCMPEDEWPELRYQDEHNGGSLIVDCAYSDSDWILGIEMLAAPVGETGTNLSPHHWVLASRAWERVHVIHIPYPPGSHINLSGEFLMDAGGPIYVG